MFWQDGRRGRLYWPHAYGFCRILTTVFCRGVGRISAKERKDRVLKELMDGLVSTHPSHEERVWLLSQPFVMDAALALSEDNFGCF